MNWLDLYTEWASDCTDAPSIFHTWGGYMALASALGRQVTFDFGPWKLPCNLYVLLLAPSSIFRKTTELNLSRRIAGKVGAYQLAADGSPEGLIDDLQKNSQGTLYYSELASLLAAFNRDYSSSLRPLLTELYDCPDTYRRRLRSQEITVESPSVNIFAASVLDWVLDRIKQADFAGGFLTRFVIVIATEKEQSFAIPPPSDIKAENALVKRLHDVKESVKGDVDLEPIRRPYEAWAAGFEKRAKSPLLAAFISRLAIMGLKLTVLEQAAEDASTHLTEDALGRAISNVETVTDTIEDLEENELGYGNDRESQDLRKVSRLIREAGEIQRTELMQKSRLTKKRLESALSTLTESGQALVKTYRKPDGGRPLQVVFWQGNGDVQTAQTTREV